MTEEEMAADKAKKDAAGGVMLEKFIDSMKDAMEGFKKSCDSLAQRMDAMEEERKADRAKKDAEEEEEKKKADAARKDAEEKERKDATAKKDAEKDEPKEVAADKSKKDGETEGKDFERKDAQTGAVPPEVLKMFEQLNAKIPTPRADTDLDRMTAIQARADAVYQEFGEKAPRFQDGETEQVYMRRLLNPLKTHSKQWGKTDLSIISDSAMLDTIGGQIFEDAIRAARNPATLAVGEIRPIKRIDEAGRTVRTYHCDPRAWMSSFMTPRQASKYLGKPENRPH